MLGYGHRSMFPEYPYSEPRKRDLVIIEKGSVYDYMGDRLLSNSPSGIVDFIVSHPVAAFTGDFNDVDFTDTLYELVCDERVKVLCNKRGNPILARIQAGKQTRWIVSARSWSNRENPDPEWIKDMEELYTYYGLGYYPTPSSLGYGLTRKVWGEHHLARHTSPSIACERFVRKNCVGGIVQTPGIGRRYRSLMMLDMSSAWVSQYVLHPTGTPEVINHDSNLGLYFEFFVECDVFIPHTLSLGPFPVRTGKKDGQRVIYPTEIGIYRSVYLWRIQIDDCHKSGCYVSIKRGYAWRDYTTDNSIWSEYAYEKRQRAHNGFIAKQSKAINVATIGRNFRSRQGYILKGCADTTLETRDGYRGSLAEIQTGKGITPNSRKYDMEGISKGIQLVNSRREPVNMYVIPETDNHSTFMVHWYAYTIAQCNSNVYNFALPYAKQGRLVAIDYDSIMITEQDERHMYIRKESFDALSCPPGTWLWMQLHNVHILNHRSFKSDELTKMPGVMR